MSKICSECGTANEDKYEYCKNCGAKLQTNQQENTYNSTPQETHEFINQSPNYNYTDKNSTENTNQNSNNQYQTYNSYTNPCYAKSIDGIPTDEMILFIGKKSTDIMPKFTKMEVTQSKVSWCWPAAILGFLLGPIGSAMWFFYRKMYKVALILLAIGVVITTSVAILSYGRNSQLSSSILNSFTSKDLNSITNILENLNTPETIKDIIASGIERIASIASCVITGIYGFYFYKQHCVKKIHNFRIYQTDMRYYKLGIASIGGISGGMLAIGIISYIIINNIASLFTFLISLI